MLHLWCKHHAPPVNDSFACCIDNVADKGQHAYLKTTITTDTTLWRVRHCEGVRVTTSSLTLSLTP